MLRRAFRLPLGPTTLKTGAKSYGSSLFLLKYKPNGLTHHRFAAIVSVKAGKTAVIRHIIKRTFLAVAEHWPLGPDPMDILFIASPRLVGLAKKELPGLLRAELAAALRRLYS